MLNSKIEDLSNNLTDKYAELVDEFNTHLLDSSVYRVSLNTSINEALDSLSADISNAVEEIYRVDTSLSDLRDYVDFEIAASNYEITENVNQQIADISTNFSERIDIVEDNLNNHIIDCNSSIISAVETLNSSLSFLQEYVDELTEDVYSDIISSVDSSFIELKSDYKNLSEEIEDIKAIIGIDSSTEDSDVIAKLRELIEKNSEKLAWRALTSQIQQSEQTYIWRKLPEV